MGPNREVTSTHSNGSSISSHSSAASRPRYIPPNQRQSTSNLSTNQRNKKNKNEWPPSRRRVPPNLERKHSPRKVPSPQRPQQRSNRSSTTNSPRRDHQVITSL